MAAPNCFSIIIAIFFLHTKVRISLNAPSTQVTPELPVLSTELALCHLLVLRIWWWLLDFLKTVIIVLQFHTN
jgi:hypothetical protein